MGFSCLFFYLCRTLNVQIKPIQMIKYQMVDLVGQYKKIKPEVDEAIIEIMNKIIRDLNSSKKKSYDLIIVGGGIYGVMLAFEASRRGLKSLLLERSDFGGATTFNSLRILHGGFRYLQTMDIHRFRESVGPLAVSQEKI